MNTLLELIPYIGSIVLLILSGAFLDAKAGK